MTIETHENKGIASRQQMACDKPWFLDFKFFVITEEKDRKRVLLQNEVSLISVRALHQSQRLVYPFL